MADEALDAFTSLLQHVPGWITDLENVLRASTERQQEILAAEQPIPPLPTRSPSKSSSLTSRWSKRSTTRVNANPPAQDPDPSMLQPQLPHLTNSDALRLTQRKRKTPSVCSAAPSGPSPHRQRGLIVIYYDSDVQSRFETLVRSIGASRNAIRKGKMGAKVEALSRTGSSSSEGSGEEASPDFGKLNYKSTRRTGRSMFGKIDDTEIFDRVDGFLEKGQSACERAAHQVLRDGDCSVELNAARDCFQNALRLAGDEVPGLTKKAERAAARRRRSVERHRAEQAEHLRPARSTIGVPDVISTLLLPPDAKLKADLEADDELEIDEDDNDDDDFCLPVLPPTRSKYLMQTSRLYAH